MELAGKSTAPKAMFVEHLLYANAFRGSAVVVQHWEIHFADMLDTAFDDEYSGAKWERENVLRFKASGSKTAAASDVVVIRNDSSQSISFLTLKALDLFIAFDIATGAVMELTAPAQRQWTDLSWVKIEGKLSNGRYLPSTGVNFQLPERSTGQFKYVVNVDDSGVRIQEVQQGARIYQ